MQQTLEAGGLEAGAELLVDPGVEGDREPHVEAGGDRPPWHLLPVPPDRTKIQLEIQKTKIQRQFLIENPPDRPSVLSGANPV